MELVHECTYRADLDTTRLMVGPGPLGVRVVSTVIGGWCKGERLSGTLRGAAGDWMLVGNDGFARLDVRGQIVTDDGAVVLITYTGLLEMNQKVTAAAGGETQFDDQYFRTLIRMESGSPKYAWVNTTVFVGRGRVVPSAVEYEVYRLT
ncbi:MAG TPA: DUF3237 domain-containing protein [Rubrivivax sp.]|jgi:hypothetical protein|nr:DUF3237 domain-containing protein [Rubrivivax sp.]